MEDPLPRVRGVGTMLIAFARVAQVTVSSTHDHMVMGSNPSRPTQPIILKWSVNEYHIVGRYSAFDLMYHQDIWRSINA